MSKYVQITPDYILDANAVNWIRFICKTHEDNEVEDVSTFIDGEPINTKTLNEALGIYTALSLQNPHIIFVSEVQTHTNQRSLTYINKSNVKTVKSEDKWMYVRFQDKSRLTIEESKYTMQQLAVELNLLNGQIPQSYRFPVEYNDGLLGQ